MIWKLAYISGAGLACGVATWLTIMAIMEYRNLATWKDEERRNFAMFFAVIGLVVAGACSSWSVWRNGAVSLQDTVMAVTYWALAGLSASLGWYVVVQRLLPALCHTGAAFANAVGAAARRVLPPPPEPPATIPGVPPPVAAPLPKPVETADKGGTIPDGTPKGF